MLRATTCAHCGAKFRADRDRCPRCRAVIVVADPAAAAAKSRQLARISAGLVGVFLVALAVMWVSGESSSQPAAGRTGSTASAKIQSPTGPATSPAARRQADNQFLDPSGAGTIAYSSGDYATALTRFQEAVERNPNDAESLSNLGQIYVRLGRTAEAMPHFERATELDPQRWAYRFNLARAFHKVGNETAAVEQYRRAIELNPEDASFHLALATSYERLGKRLEAYGAYSEYLRLSPSGAEADKVRARMAELNGSDGQASAGSVR